MMIGMRERERSSRARARPSVPGSITSSTTRSTGCAANTMRMESASRAVWAVKPKHDRYWASSWVMSASSSTTRMCCMGNRERKTPKSTHRHPPQSDPNRPRIPRCSSLRNVVCKHPLTVLTYPAYRRRGQLKDLYLTDPQPLVNARLDTALSPNRAPRPATMPGEGSVAEWSIAPVLKTGGPKGSVSSNLTASAIDLGRPLEARPFQEERHSGLH